MVNGGAPPLRILLAGPLPPPIGGASVLFRMLVEGLRDSGKAEVIVVNTSPGTGGTGAIRALLRSARILFLIPWRGRRAGVWSLHANLRGRIYLGPPVYWLSRLLRKPLINRSFAGVFDQQLEALPPLHRSLLTRTYFRAEACLFETRRLTEHFRRLGIRNAVWFPNCTKTFLDADRPRGGPCRRLVFLGRIQREKGVDLLLGLAERLPEGTFLDLYGPLDAGYEARDLNERGRERIVYRGVLQPEEVAERLWAYDALVLPTFSRTEGYPGVILEAYAHGLPVITTSLPSILEIVDATSGITVPPEDPEALGAAIHRLCEDEGLFGSLQAGARAKAAAFSDGERTHQFLALCRALAEKPS